MTPLHLAAKSAHIEIVEYLIDKEADINIQDDNEVTIWLYIPLLVDYLI